MPFQCTPAPPRSVPGRNEPCRRIGSAVSAGECRSDTVSIWVSWNSSWRTAYLRSSRTEGMVKSVRGMRLAPRSKPTTLRPALVSSRARIDPGQPTPMTTASVSLSMMVIAAPLRKVRDRLRRFVVFFAEVFFDVFAISRRQAGIADHFPGRHVAIAAIYRVGKESFHRDLQHGLEEHAARRTGELRFAGFHRFERRVTVGGGKAVEILAIGLARPLVRRGNAGPEEFARIERQLVAEFGRSL